MVCNVAVVTAPTFVVNAAGVELVVVVAGDSAGLLVMMAVVAEM